MSVNVSNLSQVVAQDIDAVSTTAKHTIGFTVTDNSTGKKYRYCQIVDDVDGADGKPCAFDNADSTQVTFDQSAAAADGNYQVCGLGCATADVSADEVYVWIELRQSGEKTTALVTNIDSTALTTGDYLVWGSDDFFINTTTTGIAVALNAAAYGVAAVTAADGAAITIKWI